MAEPGFATTDIPMKPLTRREDEVLRLLAQNLSDRQIADKLFLSVNSVKWHARRIYEKLEVGGRQQAVKKGRKLGLIPGGRPGHAPMHNLPRVLTSLVGRKVEIPQVVELVSRHQLVTLTGSGGVGKTRLALAAAQELLDEFQDGVIYIDLSAVMNPEIVIQAVMAELGVVSNASLDPVDSLVIHLSEREVLLVLNNCEHLVGACSEMVMMLLSRLDRLKIMATSRAPLEVSGEVIYRVPSLAYPKEHQLHTLEDLQGFDSIVLFAERARDILPGFQLVGANYASVEAICRRLDGIPLAIELAASHCASLGAKQIAERLERSFRLLSGGTRTNLARHRTLRTTIEWSYQLISEAEQLLLRRLGVFEGGWNLQAAEQVCAGEGICEDEIAILLSRLVNKSLVQVERLEEKELRYQMLATIQQFALEALYRNDESERMRKRHYQWMAYFAAEAGPGLLTGQRFAWTKRLQPEHRNLYAALSWAIEEENDLRGGLEILFKLHTYYWWRRSSIDFCPVLQKTNQVLEARQSTPIELRVMVLYMLANCIIYDKNKDPFLDYLKQALLLSKGLDSEHWLLRACVLLEIGLLVANFEGSLDQGYQLLLEAEEILRKKEAGCSWYLGWALINKTWVLRFMGRLAEAEACCEEATQLILKTGDVWGGLQGGVYWEMAEQAYRCGNFELAKHYYAIEHAHCLESNYLVFLSHTDRILANWEREQGNFHEAWVLYCDVVRRYDRNACITCACATLTGMAANLSSLAETQQAGKARQKWMSAVRILAGLVTTHEEFHTYIPFEDRKIYDLGMEKAKKGLTLADFEQAWEEGLAMHLKQLVRYAIQA